MKTEKEIIVSAEKALVEISYLRADLRRYKRELIELLNCKEPVFDQDVGDIKAQWQEFLETFSHSTLFGE